MTHNKAAIRAAIEYLQPIADNAQLPGYAKALHIALDTMREATADRHGRGSNTQSERRRSSRMEYIERDEIYRRWNAMPAPASTVSLAAAIAQTPAADVAPVRHGRWVHDNYEDCSEQFEIVKCTNCGHKAYAMAIYVRGGNYCPNCGARMDLEVNDG